MHPLERIFIRPVSGTASDLLRQAKHDGQAGLVEALCNKYGFHQTRVLYHMYVERRVGRCLVCDKQTNFILPLKRGYNPFCSVSCSRVELMRNPHKRKRYNERITKTNLERYGAVNPMQNLDVSARAGRTRKCHTEEQRQVSRDKSMKTHIERYGQHFLSTQEGNAKWRQAYIDLYGLPPGCVPAINDKRAHTNQRRYGAACALSAPEVREQIIKTNRKRFGTDWAMQNATVKSAAISKMLSSCYSRKQIRLGGRTFFYMGYEQYLLRELVAQYGAKRVRNDPKLLPTISYRHKGRDRQYTCDAQVGNILFECKSNYTLGIKHRDAEKLRQVVAKARACRAAGYDFVCLVFDARGRLRLTTPLVHANMAKYKKAYARALASTHFSASA